MKTILPLPAKMQEKQGSFNFKKNTTVSFDPKIAEVKEFFNDYLKGDYSESDNADVKFILDESIAKEGYKLSVAEKSITVKASTRNGAFYAVQTIRQLGKFDTDKSPSVPAVEIDDYPRYNWRGLSLDESRHFFGMDEVKRYLDLMAMMKLNVFHWHLTDDVGWRIEIKKYPLLTEIGSKRVGTQSKGWGSSFVDDIPVEGFYTQEEIKEIVAYADKRGIMVFPEIDMPAHFAAAIAGYNWLACRDIPWEVPNYYGGRVPEAQGMKDWNRPACVGKETTYQFIYDVIDEITELFPAPYFHIGGDECDKNEWKKCPHCQAMMKKHNLDNVDELHGYFNNEVKKYLDKKNIQLIGWNEILDAKNIDTSIIAQYWVPQRSKKTEEFVNNGGHIIMSKHQAFYFDMTYSYRTLKTTYTFEPQLGSIKKESLSRILGVEAEVWTEFIADREKLDVFTHPRMEALGELAWTPSEKRNWHSFVERMHSHMKTLDALGVDYAVDRVSMPKFWQKAKHLKLFQNGDTYSEVKLNRQVRGK